MIGFALGLLYSNAGEWVIHKYLLHERGRRKKTFFSYHWHEHHRNARRNGGVDPDYERSVFGWHAQGKEALGVVGLAAAHLPFFWIAPFFVSAVQYSAYRYYRVHKRAHQDPEWARENLPWHYDHHMGPNQDANWCVTWPWFDWVMGTREKFVGTEREAKSRPVTIRFTAPEPSFVTEAVAYAGAAKAAR